MTKAPEFHASFDTSEQSLEVASNFLLNIHKNHFAVQFFV